MNILLDKLPSIAYISHGDNSIRFSTKIYKEGKASKVLSETKDYFIVLDRFIQTLNKDEQDSLWYFYINCRNAFDNLTIVSEIEKVLAEEMMKISKIIPIERFRTWYALHSGIPIPAELKDSLEDIPDTTLATADQTYLRKDYIGLCALSLAMTMFAPIFSTYIELTTKEHGTEWKTYYAFLLTMKSDYYHSEEMKRLYDYIVPTLNNMNVRYDTIVLSGISREEYPQWMMAIVVVKRVATGDITGDLTIQPLYKIIYRYIAQRVQAMEKEFHGKVKHRSPQPMAASEDSAISILEAYIARQEITDNLIVICEHYLKSPVYGILKLDPIIDKVLIAQTLNTHQEIYSLMYSEIEEGQIFLLKWVLNEIIPARIIDYLDRQSIVYGMLIARCFLWAHGYYDLAAIVSAIPIDNKNEHMVTGTDKRSRVKSDRNEKVDELFPFYRKTTGARKAKPPSSLQVSVFALEAMLNKNDWHLTLPEPWIMTGNLGTYSRHYAIGDEIRISLTELAIELAQRPKDQNYHSLTTGFIEMIKAQRQKRIKSEEAGVTLLSDGF